jgi:hypothetical protein
MAANGISGLGSLHLAHLAGLLLAGQVPVQHPDAAEAGQGDGQAGLGDGVHGGRHQGHGQRDARGEPAGGVGLGRQDVGGPGDQQHVIEGESQRSELLVTFHR